VLKATQVEHAYTSVCATTHEYIYALSAKTHVKHLLVMSDKLGLGSKRRNVPNGAGSVYTGRDDEAR
jgi:hypothetical protein